MAIYSYCLSAVSDSKDKLYRFYTILKEGLDGKRVGGIGSCDIDEDDEPTKSREEIEKSFGKIGKVFNLDMEGDCGILLDREPNKYETPLMEVIKELGISVRFYLTDYDTEKEGRLIIGRSGRILLEEDFEWDPKKVIGGERLFNY